ncbi:hypothetical protein PFMC_01242 [Plasmodium falciparum CAMP/Malaysia]|uniref:Uncharacterized protein n=1 Tax=Plasmodium falciparum (isolate Camp / Malaysia) TaxID=5835 RepID=A0A024XBP0_PLAFC|nr:hypothetical protein PFMC_01242 [Plasmodium falciparum CAMP/Malaysia]
MCTNGSLKKYYVVSLAFHLLKIFFGRGGLEQITYSCLYSYYILINIFNKKKGNTCITSK